ncbi:MAG: NAD(P)/FAD-dependent oxidoreductase [Planctomycetota bacterium]
MQITAAQTTNRIRRVAVVGGGPAGATAAAELAKRGVSVVLYHVDPGHGEKPCGGGVTLRALDQFPYLYDLGLRGNPISKIQLCSPRGRRVVIESAEAMFQIYSRGELDQSLRKRAQSFGAEICNEPASDVFESGGNVNITINNRTESFDAVVGADGVFSRVRRRFAGMLPKENLCPAVDELVSGIDPAEGVHLAFYKNITGYLWVFPRVDLASVGMVAREGELRGDEMRARARSYISNNLSKKYPNGKIVRSVGWAIPAPCASGEPATAVAGKKYILVGDASGLADPLTGEGIYYAILSGTVAAECLAAGTPELYHQALREKLQNELVRASHFANHYFRAHYIETVLFAAKWSPRVRRVLRDLLSGRQKYSQLDSRIRAELGWVGWILRRF